LMDQLLLDERRKLHTIQVAVKPLTRQEGGEKDETRNHRNPCEVGPRENHNF